MISIEERAYGQRKDRDLIFDVESWQESLDSRGNINKF